jgi:molecular chaperone GrpE
MKKTQQSTLVEEEPSYALDEDVERMHGEVERITSLLEQETKKSADYLTNLKYLQADFENYRKRMDREFRDIEEFSTSTLVKKLLPVLDDFDLAIATADKSPETKGFIEGLQMVQKRLVASVESEGLEQIDAVGKPFNPELHEAVDRVQGNGEQDLIVEEVRKGYIFKGRVLRPSMVKVELAMKQDKESGST